MTGLSAVVRRSAPDMRHTSNFQKYAVVHGSEILFSLLDERASALKHTRRGIETGG